MIPVVISSVASTGLPRAMPPSTANVLAPVRASTMPASRKSVAEIRPWATDWRIAPLTPTSLSEKSPSTIRPICAIDEYAITARRSGARNASSEPYTSPIAASARIVT
jgi:hypothetical protein